jgi:hypothetical protein
MLASSGNCRGERLHTASQHPTLGERKPQFRAGAMDRLSVLLDPFNQARILSSLSLTLLTYP